MLVHQLSGSLLLGGLDGRCDLSMVVVDGAVERPSEPRARETRLEHCEDGLGGDREQRVAAGVDHGRVEVGVVDELLLGAEAERLAGYGRTQTLEVLVAATQRGEPRSGDFEQRTHLEQLLQRHVRRRRHQTEARAERLRDVLGAGGGHVGAAAHSFRRPDEALRSEEAERLPHGGATDAEVVGELELVGKALAACELLRDDELPEPVCDLLVRLRHYSMPNSRLPATETGGFFWINPRSA